MALFGTKWRVFGEASPGNCNREKDLGRFFVTAGTLSARMRTELSKRRATAAIDQTRRTNSQVYGTSGKHSTSRAPAAALR